MTETLLQIQNSCLLSFNNLFNYTELPRGQFLWLASHFYQELHFDLLPDSVYNL